MFQKIKSFLFKNTSEKQTVAKNTVWLSISNFGGRLIKAVVVIYAARVLGAADWGLFSYAVTLAGFFTLLVDPGINAILVREGVRAPRDERLALFSTTFAVKVALILASAAFIIFVAPSFSTLPGALTLLPIVAIVIAGDGLRDFFASLMRLSERMEWDAITFLIENAAIVVFGFIFLHISHSPLAFTWAYAAGTVTGALSAAVVIRADFKNITSYFSRKLTPKIVRAAWPFAITASLGALLTNADILIISWMRTATDVGVYSAVIRIVQILYLVPLVVQSATLPILSRLAKTNNQKFRSILEQTLGILFLVSAPVSLGGIILATQVLGFIFGPAYVAGGLAFSILLASLFFDYATSTMSIAIFSYDRQKNFIVAAAIGGVSNVLFDLLLIPHWGITGSAVATFIAQAATNTYLWHTMKKLNYFTILPRLKIIIPAAIIMMFVTAGLLALHVNVIVNLLISAMVYLGILVACKEPLLQGVLSMISGGSA